LGKNCNFGQKSKNLWSKFVSKNKNFVKNGKFGQKSKLWSKIEILVKNRNFSQNSKFWLKIETLVKNQNFSQDLNFGQIFLNFQTFGQKS